MKLYLIKSFSTDSHIKKNPPLSQKGIREAKLLRLFLTDISFDSCFSSKEIASYGSAMLIVGDKVLIEKDERLNKKESTKTVDKNIKDFLIFLKKKDQKILVIADRAVIKTIHRLYPSSMILNEKEPE